MLYRSVLKSSDTCSLSRDKQKGKNGIEEKKLLDDVWGEVPKKQTTGTLLLLEQVN